VNDFAACCGLFNVLGGGRFMALLLLGVLIVLVIMIMRTDYIQPKERSSRPEPLLTLKHRLAYGEITAEEYERTRKVLED
jgi:uncharacterized membrane protein